MKDLKVLFILNEVYLKKLKILNVRFILNKLFFKKFNNLKVRFILNKLFSKKIENFSSPVYYELYSILNLLKHNKKWKMGTK